MKVKGNNKVSLFNIQSEVERKMRQEMTENNEYKVNPETLPGWYLNLERSKRNGLSFNEQPVPAVPNPEDFYAFPFRHISATIVGGGTYKATDFSDEKVLRKSADMLANKPAYLNHHLAAGQEVGFLGEISWKKKYTNSNGVEIPGGLEGPFIIDSVLHGDLVRKMNSPISPIDSASVTVVFDWEASHEFEDARDFFWHLGEIIDDEMVRRVVSSVEQYHESSLVWAGADPYAKMLTDDGQVTNIDNSSVFETKRFEHKSEIDERSWAKKYFVFDCLDESKMLHLSKSVPENEPNELKMNEELLKFLATIFGTTEAKIKDGSFTKADVDGKFAIKAQADFDKIETNANQYETVNKAKETAEATIEANKPKIEAFGKIETSIKEIVTSDSVDFAAEVEKLVTFKKENEAFAKQGKDRFDQLKEKAKKTYSAFAAGKPDEAITKELDESTDPAKLESYIKMWGGKLAIDFSATCSSCGSKEITFQQSDFEDPSKDKGLKQTPASSMAAGLRN